jgi:hypothetical protein
MHKRCVSTGESPGKLHMQDAPESAIRTSRTSRLPAVKTTSGLLQFFSKCNDYPDRVVGRKRIGQMVGVLPRRGFDNSSSRCPCDKYSCSNETLIEI